MGGGSSAGATPSGMINTPDGQLTTVNESGIPDGCPTFLSNVPDSPIGATINLAGACSGQVLSQWCPQNGEWSAVNAGGCSGRNCDYCRVGGGFTTGNQGGCDGVCCNIAGNGVVTGCRRTSYKADPVACCMANGVKTIGDVTCDPQYRGMAASGCLNVMVQHCGANTANMLTPGCKTFLTNLAVTQPGTVQQITGALCPGSTDPFCACYNVPVPTDLASDNAAIGLYRCLSGACQSQEAIKANLTCPTSLNICSAANNNVALTSSTSGRIAIENACGQIILNTPAPTTRPATATPVVTVAPAKTSLIPNVPNQTLAIIIAIIMVVIIVILALTAGGKGKPATTGGGRRRR